MFKNYLLTVLRNWASNKLFAFINISGLTVGLTCAVFIMLFTRDELSYDRWIPDSENLYRVWVTESNPGEPPTTVSMTSFPMLAAMVDQIPEAVAMTRLVQMQATVSVEDRQFLEPVVMVDPQFFQVVKLPFLKGDPDGVFSHPESVVISQSIARKYFGTETGIVGKSLPIREAICPNFNMECRIETHTLMVTGILRDLPHNTQLAADIVIPNTSNANPMPPSLKERWGIINTYGYVKLAQNADAEKVLAKLRDIIDRSLKLTGGDLRRPSEVLVPHLTRFWDAHLTIDRYFSLTPPGSRTTVYGFAVIGTLILLLACFNFTNLAIAGATLRAREISLRKVMGARRDQIVVQFLGEAVLMALIAFVLTVALIQPLLPSFDQLLNKPIALHYLSDWPILVVIAAIAIVAGLLSGLYPAVVLSNFKPAVALRNGAARGISAGRFRAGLVVLQFAVSIGLGIAAAIVFGQISYMRHVDVGFRKDGVVVISHLENLSPSNRESFVNALRRYPGVTEAALGGEDVPIVTAGDRTSISVRLSGAPSEEDFRQDIIGPDFASTYEVRLLAGRMLSDAHGEDRMLPGASSSFNLLINASAARRLGFSPEEAIGKTLVLTTTASSRIGTIVGIMDDIKMDGPLHRTESTIYSYQPNRMSTVSVRVRSEQLSDTLAFIDKTWSDFAPGFAIQRSLLDEVFNKQFDSDERQGTVLSLFVGIAIFIACMGLFGLAAFSAERRTKEIGLRKAFGAKTHHIVLLLLWQFSVPVLIANAIAWPFAYYYLHGWLNGYPDRISLNPLYFVGAGAAALAIAWATVYVHAYRMARVNPIKALRYE